MEGTGGFDPAIRAEGHGRQRRQLGLCPRDHGAHSLLAAVELIITPGECLAEAFAAELAGAPEATFAASRFGIQRKKGERSTTYI